MNFTGKLTQSLATQHGKAVAGALTLFTSGVALGQEAPGKVPNFDDFYKQALSGPSDTELGRLLDGQLGKVPELQHHASTVGHQVDAAVANFNGAMGQSHLISWLITSAAIFGFLRVLYWFTRQGLVIRHANRLLADIQNVVSRSDNTLLKAACEKTGFTMRRIAGLPIYRPAAAAARPRNETRGRVIVALPDFALPNDFHRLARMLSNDFHGFDVALIGSPYDPLMSNKGGLRQAGIQKKWAMEAPTKAHIALMEEKVELYPGKPLVLIGIRDGVRHTLRALAHLQIDERPTENPVILLSPSNAMYPLEKAGWWQTLTRKKKGPFHLPAWVEGARNHDHKDFHKELSNGSKGRFGNLGVHLLPVLTYSERNNEAAQRILDNLGLRSPPPLMAQSDSYEAAKEVVRQLQKWVAYEGNQTLRTG